MVLPVPSIVASHAAGGLALAASVAAPSPDPMALSPAGPFARPVIAVLIFLAISGLALVSMLRLRRAASLSGAVEAATGLSYLVGSAGLALALISALSYAAADAMPLAILGVGALMLFALAHTPIGSDLIAGWALLRDGRVQVGDWITLEAGEGRVRAITPRSTELEAADGGVLVVPNRVLVTTPFRRWPMAARGTRLWLRFPIAQGADPARALYILEKTAREAAGISREEPPIATLDEIGSSALEASLRVVADESCSAPAVASALRVEALKALRAAGIAPAHPQRDIHLRDLDGLRQAFAAAMAERQRRPPPESKS